MKRIIDLVFSIAGFTLLFPLFILVMILLMVADGTWPFFVHARSGRHMRPINVIKFKTMNDKRDAGGNLLTDAERLTFVGKIVRKTSLDEMPQLINVIRGDMSLVGPRPLLMEYIPLYSPVQRRRHEVRPGITGWAQVNGRNAIRWTEKFAFDVWYVDHMSFWLDARIVFITVLKVLKAEGISGEGVATAEKFDGGN